MPDQSSSKLTTISQDSDGMNLPSAATALTLATETQSQLQDITENDVVTIVLPLLYVKDNLTLMAERIRTTIISMIRPNDLPTRVYRFRIDQFCKVYGLNSEKIYHPLREALTKLREEFELPLEKGHGTGWISNWTITDAEVQVVLDRIIQNFYKEKAIRKFKIENIKDFVYAVTYKFYKMFTVELGEKSQMVMVLEIEDLKDRVCAKTRYEKYSDFKRRVLDPAIYNINGEKLKANSKINDKDNMCDIHVDYEEIREKRSVIAIRFTVTRIRESVESKVILDPLYESLSEDGQQAYTLLRDTIGASKSSIVNCISKYGEVTMIKIARMVMMKIADPNCNIKNQGAYAGQCLRNGDVFGEGVVHGSKIIDAEVVDEEREKLCNDLISLGLEEKFVIKTKKNKRISDNRIKKSIEEFYIQTKNGKNLNAGWIRKCIELDWLFIDTPNPLDKARKKQLEEKLKNMTPEELARYNKIEAEKEQAKKMYEEDKTAVSVEVIDEETQAKNNAAEELLKSAIEMFVNNMEPEAEEKIKAEIFESLIEIQKKILAIRGYRKDMSLEELMGENSIIYPKLVALYKDKYYPEK